MFPLKTLGSRVSRLRAPADAVSFFVGAAALAVAAVAAIGFDAESWATDYYVDSEQGADANSGRSPQEAWRSLEQVAAAELEPGDAVYFKRGGLWRGGLKPKSGVDGKPILYGAYGEGPKPRLLRSVALNRPSDWLEVGENRWATRPATTEKIDDGGAFMSGDWELYAENGAKADYRRTEIDGRETFRIVVQESGTATNHIQWSNRKFPIESGKTYRVSFDAKSTLPLGAPRISLMQESAPWSGYGRTLEIKFDPKPEFSRQEFVVQTDRTADDARTTFYFGTVPKGCELEISNLRIDEISVDALDLSPDVGNVVLVGKDGARKAAFKRWTLDDLKTDGDFCYERSEGRVWFYSKENPATRFASIEAATMRHIVDLSGVRYAIFDGLDLRYGAAHGFGGSGNSHITIRNCDLSWIGGGDQYLGGGSGRRVRFGNGIEFWATGTDHLVENCRIWEVYDAAITNQGSGVNEERNIVYRGNTIWNCEYSFEYWNRDAESITDRIEFVGNRCLFAGCGWGHEQRPDKNGRCLMFYGNTAQTSNFVVRDNVFANATESLVRSDVRWTPEQPRLDGNVYWQDDPEKPIARWQKKTYSLQEFDAYRAETEQEPNGKIERVDAKALVPTDVD